MWRWISGKPPQPPYNAPSLHTLSPVHNRVLALPRLSADPYPVHTSQSLAHKQGLRSQIPWLACKHQQAFYERLHRRHYLDTAGGIGQADLEPAENHLLESRSQRPAIAIVPA